MGLFSFAKKLFPGEASSNESGNRFADDIKGAFMPSTANFGKGMGAASSILGLNGPEAGQQALDQWWNSSGGNFLLNQGMQDVDAFYRAKGLGQSGATIKGIEDLRTNLASTKMGETMNNLFNLNQQALGAGNLIANAGQYSKGQGQGSKGGLGQAIGTALAIFGSDPRLKTNIEKVGEYPDGLGIYDYDYVPAEGAIAAFMPEGRQRGVMADEVARLRPWALGPVIDGYRTVNYGAI